MVKGTLMAFLTESRIALESDGIVEWAGRDIPNEFSRVAYRQFECTWLAFKCNHASILSIG